MEAFEKNLEQLKKISARLKKFGELSGIASYDMTATAAKGAAKRRGELLAFVRAESRRTLLSPETLELVEYFSQPEQYEKLPDVLKGELRLYRHRIDSVTGVPEALLNESAALNSSTEQMWIQCKYSGEYTELTKNLRRIIDLKKEIAQAKLEAAHLPAPIHPLDPIIDSTDAGMTVEKLSELFDEIKKRTVPLVLAIGEKGCQPDRSFAARGFDAGKQTELCWNILEKMGYSSRYGVMGKGEHPCTYGINRYDVRFTNHIYENDLLQGVNSAMHEGGHGLYEMNVSEEYLDLLVGTGSHGALHEGSSRFWENIVGRSLPFWEYAAPLFKNAFPDKLADVNPMDFYRAINCAKPGTVRIYADELTYNLHIMLRFELEKMLFDGSLSVSDLPDAWNQMMQEYLGIMPEKPEEGWVQDMHWPAGMFGYFQSYTLGNLYNAQIAHTMRKDLPQFDMLLRQGNLAPIREWMTEHWYRHGCVYTDDELIRAMTGEPLSAKYLCDYLEEKFKALYEL